jgi:hypothetical protein
MIALLLIMKDIQLSIDINSGLYLKNPDVSELGRSIISKSIETIHEIGFEGFTFKKLGAIIQSPECSIYRYFENKHMLLNYLTNWYWLWLDYRLVLSTMAIDSAEDRLRIALRFLTQPILEDHSISYVNEALLSEIVFSESFKTYHTKNVGKENKKGYFSAYKHIVQRVSNIVLEISPDFMCPHMLMSTVIEGAHQQKYFAEHLPSLTDLDSDSQAISTFYETLVFSCLKK